MRGVVRVREPSAVEVKAREFVDEYAGLVEEAGPLALNLIAREGTLLGIELSDEITEAANRYAGALNDASRLANRGASAKEVAVIEAAVPHLKKEYERMMDLATELNDLTDRAMERVERPDAEVQAEVDEAVRWLESAAKPWWQRRSFWQRLFG